jgi:sugar lactone lactonase YvrE
MYYGVSMTVGDIYTVAGTGTAGYSGNAGAATSAKLSDPYDVAIDAHGNLVVADKNNQRIRVVAESAGTYYGISMTPGDIYAVAGNGTASYGGDGGVGTSANVNYPKGVAIDPQGNIAIADTQNFRVRVIAGSTGTFYGQSMTAGYIYTIAGTGTTGFSGDEGAATSAKLDQPAGIAFDNDGNAVVADTGNQRIRVIAASNGTFYGQSMTSGDIYSVAGSGSSGFLEDGVPATYAQLSLPGGVAVDAAGRLVIADTWDDRIRELSGGPTSAALVSPIGGAIGLDLHSPSGSYWSSQQATSAAGGSGSASGQPSGSTTSGSTPVDPASGDFSSFTTDVSLPGAGVPLAYARTYDSQVAQNEVNTGSPGGALGFGWSSNLGMSLAYNSTTHVATITEENGAQITFNPYGSQWWCSGAQNFCATAPRTVATLNQNVSGTWTFTRTNGPEQVFTFTSAGVLSSIADAQGDSLTEGTYSPGVGQAACPSGDSCVAWTSSASGRELVIATKTSSGQVNRPGFHDCSGYWVTASRAGAS